MAKLDSQLARMQALFNYGLTTENKKDNGSSLEYSMTGADGKAYGIIRENHKYYIKSADKANQMIAESYNYIGGWNNKKENEYDSYNAALKNFELKMRSLNEAHDVTLSVEALDPFKKENLVVEGTQKMQDEIARMRQIMHNTAAILNEGIGATPIKSQPEAKRANSGDKDAPFTETAKYEENRDGKKVTRKPVDKDNTKADKPNMEDDKMRKGGKSQNDFKDVHDDLKGEGVADKHAKGGKVVRVNEECCGNCEAQNGVVSDKMKDWGRVAGHADATVWDEADMQEPHLNEDEDTFAAGLPGAAGTGEVGDDAPFTNSVDEGCDETCAEGCDELCEVEDEPIEDEVPVEGDEEEPVEDEPVEDDEEPVEGDEEEPVEDDEFADDEEPAEGDEEPVEDDEFADDEEPVEDEEEPVEDDEFADDEEPVEDEEEPVEDDEYADDEEPVEDEASVDEEDPESVRAEIERLQGVLAGLEGGEEEPVEDEPVEDDEEPVEDDEYADDEEPVEDDEYADDEEPVEGDEVADDEAAEETDECGTGYPLMEAKQKFMNSIVESVVKSLKEETTVLHDFGKHPGYRKKPMELPATGEDKNQHGEDWNDDSVHTEQPFGQQIGSSAPFSEKAVKMITDAVLAELKKK